MDVAIMWLSKYLNRPANVMSNVAFCRPIQIK